MVVAKVRELGVRDRDMVCRVDVESRHRDRGIEAAMAESVSKEKERDEGEK